MNRPVPRLHLIGPLVADPSDYPRLAAAAVRGGCDAIHVRVPGGTTQDVLELARAVRDVSTQAMLIVNDRLDIALVAGADGVQLGERGFSVDDARRVLPPWMLIGRSVHDIAGARSACEAGADFLLAGHIFDTPSKHGVPGRGLDWLADVVSAVQIPVIALGGISINRIPSVLAAGTHGVALGRELLCAADPEQAAAAATHLMASYEPTSLKV